MKLSESEKANPQDYFLQSGVDGEGNPIYNLLHEFVDDYLPFKSIRKKVFDGQADIVIQSDTIQIYWKSNLIAEAQLDGQVEVAPDDWQGQLFSFADANISKITEVDDGEGGTIPITPFYRAYVVKDIPALGITDAVLGLDIHWAFKDTKLSFYLDAPGFNARIRWQCRVKDSAVAWTDNTDPENPIYHRGLNFNVSDYEGAVNKGSQADPEAGWTQHWWTFEPDGKQIDPADARTPLERYEQGVGLVVDPYLSVDEQATYFDITMDGVVARVWDNGSESFIGKIYDKDAVGTTDLFSFGSKVVVGGTTYAISEDVGIVVTLIENTPLRVILRAQGNFESSAQADLSGEQDSVLWMIFYPDRIAMRIELNVTASITLSDNAANGLIFMDSVIANLTSEDSKYESGGSETDAGGDGSQAGADYIATLATEIDIMGVAIENTLGGGTGTYVQYIDDPGVR
jgi:hypothetical protein